ncbi:DLH domain-containing protein [Balamuthia mandrillaris]
MQQQQQEAAAAENKVTFEAVPENKKGKVPGYLFGAAGKQRGLVVIQEWWGVNAQIKGLAARLASDLDCLALVPDLYRGEVATDHEHAGHLMSGLDWAGAISDIRGAVQYLLSQGCTKVAVTGTCMGGALALAASILVEELTAAVVFYGICSPELADPTKVRVPIQCHFGLKDSLAGFSDPAAQDALEAKLKEGEANYEFYRYEGADHAFLNEARPEVYNEEAAKLALCRMKDFVEKHLA